ncbi:MAG TPA: hypothetical protein VIM60_04045 [Edaphobacter sp.]
MSIDKLSDGNYLVAICPVDAEVHLKAQNRNLDWQAVSSILNKTLGMNDEEIAIVEETIAKTNSWTNREGLPLSDEAAQSLGWNIQ